MFNYNLYARNIRIKINVRFNLKSENKKYKSCFFVEKGNVLKDSRLRFDNSDGIGNYLRVEILFRIDSNPFVTAKNYISNNPQVLDLCKKVPLESYKLGGGLFAPELNPLSLVLK